MRRSPSHSVAVVASIAALLVGGCGDLASADGSETAHRDQSVTVVPKFTIAGTRRLPGKLHFQTLGLSISEIRLEPIGDQPARTAYSTANSTRLWFDVARGETSLVGESLELPEAGRYAVGVRLEPVAAVNHSAAGSAEDVRPSFSISGYVAGTPASSDDPRFDNKTDGRPIPVPYDRRKTDSNDDSDDEPDAQQRSMLSSKWTPFHYDSQQPTFITLGEVDLTGGSQNLSFTFNVHDWALELVEPLLSAVNHAEGVGSSHEPGIDVTSPLDSTGHGAESLFENTMVQAFTSAQGAH